MIDSRKRSAVDEREQTDEGKISLAGARAAVESVGLMTRALRASGVQQKTIAQRLGVSDGRVSQILGGLGNVRVTTLARVLRAAGYRLRFEAIPADAGVAVLRQPGRRPGRQKGRTFRYTAVATTDCVDLERGVGPANYLILSDSHPRSLDLRYEAVHDAQTGELHIFGGAPSGAKAADGRQVTVAEVNRA